MQKVYAFAEFETFYDLYRPLTPYGRLHRERRQFHTDAAELKAAYDRTAALLAWLKANRPRADKLRYHLKNIPLLETSAEALSTATGLFQARKFLANARGAFRLLPAPLRAKLGAKFGLDDLLALLDKGGSGEAFHISDAYSAELAAERRAIAEADAGLKKLRDGKLKQLRERHGLDFSERDFLVVDEREAAKLAGSPDFFLEPFDASRLTVKPVFGQDYHELRAQRDKRRAAEADLESAVVRRLGAAVAAGKKELEACAAAVERLDIAAERARLALELPLARPVVNRHPSPLCLDKARFLPLEARLKAAGMKYTPLTADFSRRVNIISGSNMGGKTVALKTLAFCQLLAQSGFFVPAAAFTTCLFGTAAFMGAAAAEPAGGLSSFGLEMNDFAAAHAGLKDGPALLLMDEFARTTNSEEAAALLSAMLEDLCAGPNAYVFLATHFSGLKTGGKTGWFKMRGFDTAAFNAYFSAKPACGLDEKLKMINRFMRYELAEGGAGEEARDAIKIAGILGVSARIVKRARELMEAK